MDKIILDACCGGKMFWFDKENKNVCFIDNRVAEKGHRKHRMTHEVKPDILMDFREMEFEDKIFKLVVFDPPHMIRAGKNSDMRKAYGGLNRETWREDIKKGFEECWRVLDDYGTLIFKWSEYDIKVSEVLKLFEQKPLFGHKSGKSMKTHWICFMKIPNG